MPEQPSMTLDEFKEKLLPEAGEFYEVNGRVRHSTKRRPCFIKHGDMVPCCPIETFFEPDDMANITVAVLGEKLGLSFDDTCTIANSSDGFNDTEELDPYDYDLHRWFIEVMCKTGPTR